MGNFEEEYERQASLRYMGENEETADIVIKPDWSQGLKFDSEKLRYDLVPPEALAEFVKVLTFGAKKYTDRNWEQGINYSRVLGALKRHLAAWEMGENDDTDEESDLSPMAHVICCAMFLLTFDLRGQWDFDDIPTREHLYTITEQK